MAYRLALPQDSTIHPVFHVSQLKSSHGAVLVSPDLPPADVELQILARVLQRRWTSGNHPVEQALIQWLGIPMSLATWENLEHIR